MKRNTKKNKPLIQIHNIKYIKKDYKREGEEREEIYN